MAYLSKPLLMVSLLLYFLSRTEKLPNTTKWWIAAALTFSLVGDVFLLKSTEFNFLAGVGSFALAHICYAIFFNRRRSGSIIVSALIGNIILVVFLLLGLNHLVNIPDEMMIPVNVYGAILGLNLIASVQFNYSNHAKNYWVPLGVLLFVVSDLLLAVNKFETYSKELEYAVIITYGLAQYLIATGVLKHFKVYEVPSSN